MMKRIMMILLAGLLLASCRPYPGPPWQQWMYDGPPASPDGRPYPPLYVTGWQHGCETGTGAISNTYYRMFHSWRQDAGLAQNKVYYQGWKDGLDYCYRYLYQYLSKPFL